MPIKDNAMSNNMTMFSVNISGFDNLDVLSVDLPTFNLSNDELTHNVITLTVVNNLLTSQQVWKWLMNEKKLLNNERDMSITLMGNYTSPYERWDMKDVSIVSVSFGRLNKRSDDRSLITLVLDFDNASLIQL